MGGAAAVSQHLNIKLHLSADEVIGWALGRARDRAILERLDAEVEKHKCAGRLGGGHPRTRPNHLGGDSRAVATRFLKRAYVFQGTMTVAAIRLWLPG